MTLETGRKGEKVAEKFLRKKGFKILEKNYRTPLGEIDLICLDAETLTFVEVKANTTEEFGSPELRVNHKKQRQITKTALVYLKQKRIHDFDCRFDVVSVLFKNEANPQIEHFENAFQVNEDWEQ